MLSTSRMATLTAMLALCACGGTTGGALVTLPFQVGGIQGPLTFQNPLGWTVTLQAAQIWLGPFYFNAFESTLGQAPTDVVIVQATEQVLVNALDSTFSQVSGGADGETGQAVAAQIYLLPPGQTPENTTTCPFLGQQLGAVAGTATNGQTTIAFSGPIAIPNTSSVQVSCLELQILNGVSASLNFMSGGQILSLTIDPTHWFDLVDFGQLVQGTPSGDVYTWSVQSEFMAQLIQGVKSQSGVYTFQLLSQ